MGRGQAASGSRWSPAWAGMIALLALIPFVLLGGLGVMLAVQDVGEDDPSIKLDGNHTVLGSLLAGWAFLHAMPWVLFLWRRKQHWFVFGAIAFVLAAVMGVGIWSMLHGE